MQETKSSQLEGKRQAIEAEIQTAKPGDTGKIMLEIALATLEAQIEMLQLIARNVRN